MSTSETRLLWVCGFVNLILSVPIGDRVAYYVSRNKDQISLYIEKVPPSSTDWTIEEVFWAFDQPVDDCIPITVYSTVNGHGITQFGHENILFWFFAFDSTDHSSLRHIKPTQYSVYQNQSKFNIWKNRDINQSILSTDQTFLFTFYAFEYDDKYVQNITVHNCHNCTLIPAFAPETYTYYIVTPSDVSNMYFSTKPSENVTFVFDNPTYLLSEEEALQTKVSQIIDYNIDSFENINSLQTNEIEKVMLSFYNKNQIDNNTIAQYRNTSLYQWIAAFVRDDTVHHLIETKYKNISQKLGNIIHKKDSLDFDGLLHEPWTPITVDIHYDLNHYRIFVIRKSGELDVKLFQKSIELNRNAYLEPFERECPDISLDAIVHSDIPQWWDPIRVWVVSVTVFIIMSAYICYSRYSFNQLVRKHKSAISETKGG